MKPIVTRLPSGATLVVVPMEENPTITAAFYVRTGAEYERPEEHGLSHFLEHMCFKGTTTYPNAHALTTTLDSMGAHYNAFTSREMTAFYAKVARVHGEAAFALIADIVTNSTFPEAEVEKEKGVVIEEIRMYNDRPEAQVDEVFTRGFFGDQPAGRPIIGTEASVQSFTSADCHKYWRTHYTGSALTIVLSGAITPAVARQWVKQYVHIPKGKSVQKKKVRLPKKGGVYHHDKKTDQVHLVLGVPTVPLGHTDEAVAAVTSGILGKGMSSRLFIRLRESLGIAYYAYSNVEHATDYGIFSISAGVAKDRVEEALAGIIEEIELLSHTLVPDDELQKTKQFLIGTAALSFESSNQRAHYYGGQYVLTGNAYTPAAWQKQITAVTKEAVRAYARKIFAPEKRHLAVVGTVDTASLTSLLHRKGVR